MVTVPAFLMVISGFCPIVGILRLLSVLVISISIIAVMNAVPAAIRSVVKHYFGPTKVGLSLIYVLK